MTRQPLYALAWATAAATTASLDVADANDVSFANKCAFSIALYNLADPEPRAATAIASGAVWTNANVSGYNYYRHGDSAEATVVSLRFDPQRGSSYDVSIIPPQALYCSSFEACRDEAHGQRGFNVPVQVVPAPVTAPSERCKPVTCGADDPTRCSDGFLFPTDSSDKYKLCAADQSFQIMFCPDGTAAISSVVGSGDVSGAVGEVLPGNLRGSGSTGGQSFTNSTGAITFTQASTTPSMVPAASTSPAATTASVGFDFDAIAGDSANGVAAAVLAVAPGAGSNGSA